MEPSLLENVVPYIKDIPRNYRSAFDENPNWREAESMCMTTGLFYAPAMTFDIAKVSGAAQGHTPAMLLLNALMIVGVLGVVEKGRNIREWIASNPRPDVQQELELTV